MNASEIEGCCALQVVSELDCLYADDMLSREEAEGFPEYLKPIGKRKAGHWTSGILSGDHVTTSIVTISPLDVTKAQFARLKATLRSYGFKLLGKFPGGESSRPYLIELWGSKEFKTGGQHADSRSKSARRPRKADARSTIKRNHTK